MNWLRCQWNQEAATYLRRELAPDENAIRAEVDAGIASLWFIEGHGWLITRVDVEADGTAELVLVAIRGQDVGPVVERAKQLAQESGIPSIRFHSSRRGAEKFVAPLGFEPVETVYRYEVPNGI
ncbi:MAG: hypothetical protein ACRBBW_21345 [Cellvibrionaceae bacterium]